MNCFKTSKTTRKRKLSNKLKQICNHLLPTELKHGCGVTRQKLTLFDF